MPVETLPWVLATFFGAALLKGVTGLGFSTLCLPALALFLEPRAAIPLVILPSLLSNVLVMAGGGGTGTALRRFWLVYLSALPGLFVGVSLLAAIDSAISRAILGAILVAYALWALRTQTLRLPPTTEARLRAPVGFCNGVINGLTGSQVMPVLPYLLSLNLERDLFLQAINLAFTSASLVMLLLLNRVGLLSAATLQVSAIGAVAVVLGVTLGARIRKRLPEGRYRQLVLAFLLVLGLSLIVRVL